MVIYIRLFSKNSTVYPRRGRSTHPMQFAAASDSLRRNLDVRQAPRSRSLLGACLAHILHDGYTDQLYALLPVWQAQFGLSYAGLAMIRALYYGTMGGLQVPADRLMKGWT